MEEAEHSEREDVKIRTEVDWDLPTDSRVKSEPSSLDTDMKWGTYIGEARKEKESVTSNDRDSICHTQLHSVDPSSLDIYTKWDMSTPEINLRGK